MNKSFNRQSINNSFLRRFFTCLLLTVSYINIHTANAQQQNPPSVEVANPLSKKIVEWDMYTGQFLAAESVDINARVAGYIKSVNFVEGSLVKKGDILYEIDPRPFEAELAQAEAQLEVAKAQEKLAVIQNKRAAELLRRRVGTQANADEAFAQLAQTSAQVAVAEAQVLSAKLNLDFTKIESPISGRISATNLDVGNLITGNGAATPLANIVSLDPIEFSFTASEAAYLKYARLSLSGGRQSSRDVKNEVRVNLSDENSWQRKGFMSFVDNRLDPNSGTIEGRAIFENKDLFLQPGIYGRLRLAGSQEYEAMFIPDEAVLSDQSQKIVYVLDDENNASERIVVLGPIQNGMRIIRKGIEQNDKVIIRGIQRVRSGAPVTPTLVELQFEGSDNQ